MWCILQAVELAEQGNEEPAHDGDPDGVTFPPFAALRASCRLFS